MAAIFTTAGALAYANAISNKTKIQIGKLVISNNTAAVTVDMTTLTNLHGEYERIHMTTGFDGSSVSFTAYCTLPDNGGNKQIGVYSTDGVLLAVERVVVAAYSSENPRDIVGLSLTDISDPRVFASPLFAPNAIASAREAIRVSRELENFVLLATPEAQEGHVIKANSRFDSFSSWLMTNTAVVDNDESMALARNSIISMEEIFNTWYRFSHAKNNYVYPGNATELNGWALNANKELYTTVNSGSYIGFVSPTKHIDYELDVQIRSTSADDDAASLVVAFETVGGVEHNISVIRCLGGFPAWTYRVYYNYNQSNELLLANLDHTVMWGDGVHGSNRASTPYVQNGGWSRADIAAGVRIKVTRSGDNITFETSDFGSTTLLTGAAKHTLNLGSRPELAPLRAPASYGYGSFSQPNTFFRTTTMLDKNNVIADVRDGKIYAHNGTAWVDTGRTFLDSFGGNSMLYAKLSKRMYHIKADGTLVRII